MSHSNNVRVQNCELYQGAADCGDNKAGIRLGLGNANCEISGNLIGRNTGDPTRDHNYASFIGILVRGKNTKIYGNTINHTGAEETMFTPEPPGNAFFSHGIKVIDVDGTTEVYNNTIYHTGGHGISVHFVGNSGDELRIYDNTISYAGQAGIHFYETSGDGGTGYIYRNDVSYSDRTAGTPAARGNSSMGIHMNGGSKTKGFDRVYIYENVVHHSQAPNKPNIPDQGGIGLDYYAHGVHVYRNLIHNNWGKGIYIYNANDCKVYYNVVFGNDCGITVGATEGLTAENNLVCNNVFYKNYNTDAFGRNVDAEISWGPRAIGCTIRNNICYAHNSGCTYKYFMGGSLNNTVDHNLLYQESGTVCYDNGKVDQTFVEWKARFPSWDRNSMSQDPLLKDPERRVFRLEANSPCIDKGQAIGLTQDVAGNPVPGGAAVDIGAFEWNSIRPPRDFRLKDLG